ncbi:MAG TPA: hypothetical protein PKY72_05160 [Bacilli bacterium]|jgi:hypothetical protein|nr:hypothetical protein [Bacilli bacterium]HOD61426.1 hypothetical protein [Bacilli bacterium]HOR17800.1 hypothetical protein [Bacilli bacterium]HQQ39667.1 hypothetical protein [Bacilli bacterium]
MHTLEENFIRAVLLANAINNKIDIKTKLMSKEELKESLKLIVYQDMSMMVNQMLVFQARKLFEAKELKMNNQLFGLTDEEWKYLKLLREEFTHAKTYESQKLRVLGDANTDLYPLIGKLFDFIVKKHLLNDDNFNKFNIEYERVVFEL